MTNVLLGTFFANKVTSVSSALHSRSLFVDHHMMSLNIDMAIIRPLNGDGSLIFDRNSWTLLTSCNVVDSGEIFHSSSFGSPSIVSEVLDCDESLNQLNFSSQYLMLGSDSPFQD